MHPSVHLQFMKTSRDDIYAAGDVTEFPLFMAGDTKVNIQHVQMAGQQGIVRLGHIDENVKNGLVSIVWNLHLCPDVTMIWLNAMTVCVANVAR